MSSRVATCFLPKHSFSQKTRNFPTRLYINGIGAVLSEQCNLFEIDGRNQDPEDSVNKIIDTLKCLQIAKQFVSLFQQINFKFIYLYQHNNSSKINK